MDLQPPLRRQRLDDDGSSNPGSPTADTQQHPTTVPLQTELHSITSEHNDLHERIQALEATVEGYKEEIKSLEQHKENLREDATNEHARYDALWTETIPRTRAALAQVQRDSTAKDERIATLEQELKTKLENLTEARVKEEAMLVTITTLTANVQAVRLELTTLQQTEANDEVELQMEVDRLTTEVNAKDAIIATTARNLEVSTDQVGDLTAKLIAKDGFIEAKDKTISTLEKKIAGHAIIEQERFKTQLNVHAQHEAELSRLRADIQAHNMGSYTALQQQNATLKANAEALEEKVFQLRINGDGRMAMTSAEFYEYKTIPALKKEIATMTNLLVHQPGDMELMRRKVQQAEEMARQARDGSDHYEIDGQPKWER